MSKWAFLLITLSATLLHDENLARYFVIWNVGQGQWITSTSSTNCLHFDAGGEFFPIKKISLFCGNKKNMFYLSHWDWDHISGIAKLKNSFVQNSCLAQVPLGTTTTKKRKLVEKLQRCSSIDSEQEVLRWTPHQHTDSNSQCHVFQLDRYLIPGDSPVGQEKIWARLPSLKKAKILILGHHGSQTSTSEFLLQNLPNIRLAIASARWARYHHPHSIIELRLKKARIPLLRTEDWGSIWLER